MAVEKNESEASADIDTGESSLTARDAAEPSARRHSQQVLLSNADQRDERAELRDHEADERDRKADLEEFLDQNEPYGRGLPARRDAAADRAHARDDRTSSAEDREDLAERNSPDLEGSQQPT